jgi:hypothetical protein
MHMKAIACRLCMHFPVKANITRADTRTMQCESRLLLQSHTRGAFPTTDAGLACACFAGDGLFGLYTGLAGVERGSAARRQPSPSSQANEV